MAKKNICNAAVPLLLSFVFFVFIPAKSADPLDNWHWRNQSPQGKSLNSITFGSNMFIAVGQSGTILTSGDGIKWSAQYSGVNDELRNITCGNNIFVAVGNGQTNLISVDGINWLSQNPEWSLYGLTYGNNIFAGSENDMDQEWPRRRSARNRQGLLGITYGNKTFVAVGDLGVILTSVDGFNWVNRISGTSNQLTGVAYGNNTFVAVGWDRETRSGIILTSCDGVKWSIQNFEHNSFFRFTGVAYGNNIFVAAGYGKIFTSGDGIRWSSPRTVNAVFNSITCGNNTFVAAGEDGETGSSIIITSVDAVNWKRRRLGVDNDIFGIAYGNNTFVAVGSGGAILQSGDLSGSKYQDEPLNILSYVYPKPVKISNEFKIKIVFNKTLDTKYQPVVALIGNGKVAPLVEKGGEIKTTSQVNDTYIVPDIILNKDMAGEITIAVSAARDSDGNVIKNIAEETFILKPEKGFNLDKPDCIVIKEGNTAFAERINIKFNITGAEEMMITEDAAFKNSKWESFDSVKIFHLSDSEGEKAVYFKFKDKEGNISMPAAKIVTLIIPARNKPQNVKAEVPAETQRVETARAEPQPSLQANSELKMKIIYSEEFKSKNGEYAVNVGYEKGGGAGRAQYLIKNKKGETVNKFIASTAPRIVIPADDGKSLIAFGGNWAETDYLDKICFYNVQGELIKEHISEINLNGEYLISENSRYFIMTYGLYFKRNITLFNVLTGEKLWDIKTDINITELKISKNGEWLIACGSFDIDRKKAEKNYKKYKIYLIDNSGKIYWQKEEELAARTGGSDLLAEINGDGTMFAVKERGSKVFAGKKGIRERHIYKKSIYKNINGNITQDKVLNNISEPENP